MADAQYEIKIGWENNTDFEGLYDDVSDDVTSFSFSRGKSDELGKANVGSCSVVLNNADAKYTPTNSSGVLYGNLLPKRPIRIRAVQQLVSSSVTKALAATGDYAAEDVLSESASAGTAWTFSGMTKLKGGFGKITKAQAICETTGLAPRLVLYLFSATPTCNLNDNAANTALLHADLANYIGRIDFSAMEDLGGDSEAIETEGTYGNLPLAFNCALDSTSLYGVLVTRDDIEGERAGDDMTIKLTVELPQYDLFYGFIEEIIPHPHLSEQDCVITAADGIDYLSRHDMATALYKDAHTGTIQSYILDDALWNMDMRLIDDGQDTVPYWYGHNVKARYAQEQIDDSEQGFSFIDGAGHYHFEDRHHRSTATHQTSQATFDNTMSNITYSLNPKNVYNQIKVTVTPWELKSLTTLWTLQETPSIPAGEARSWWADASVSGQSVFVDAWTTLVATTDYTANSESGGGGTDMTSDIAVTLSKLAKTMKITLTNNGSVPAYITLLQARGTYYDDLTKVTLKAEDSTSQTAYQKRTYEIDGKYMTDADKAQDYVDYAIGKYKDPRAELGMSAMNQDTATLTSILSLEISDRITVVNTTLGVNDDYFIDYMEHDVSMGGKLHTVNYRLSDTLAEDFWCLDYSALASSSDEGQTKLGY